PLFRQIQHFATRGSTGDETSPGLDKRRRLEAGAPAGRMPAVPIPFRILSTIRPDRQRDAGAPNPSFSLKRNKVAADGSSHLPLGPGPPPRAARLRPG